MNSWNELAITSSITSFLFIKGLKTKVIHIKIKAISMMHRKSPPSELILEIIKSNNSFKFLKEFVKGDSFIFCQNVVLFYFFTFI